MLHPVRKLASCAVLTAAAFLGTTSQAHAQAMPIANGHLEGGPSIVTPVPSFIDLTFALRELPDGSIAGSGKITNKAAGGWVQFELHSYFFGGDGTLFTAGIVSQEHNTGGFWAVGDTVFFAVKDDVDGNGTDQFIEGRVPAAFGPLTIQQIIAAIGPPPPEFYRQGLSGNIHFH